MEGRETLHMDKYKETKNDWNYTSCMFTSLVIWNLKKFRALNFCCIEYTLLYYSNVAIMLRKDHLYVVYFVMPMNVNMVLGWAHNSGFVADFYMRLRLVVEWRATDSHPLLMYLQMYKGTQKMTASVQQVLPVLQMDSSTSVCVSLVGTIICYLTRLWCSFSYAVMHLCRVADVPDFAFNLGTI